MKCIQSSSFKSSGVDDSLSSFYLHIEKPMQSKFSSRLRCDTVINYTRPTALTKTVQRKCKLGFTCFPRKKVYHQVQCQTNFGGSARVTLVCRNQNAIRQLYNVSSSHFEINQLVPLPSLKWAVRWLILVLGTTTLEALTSLSL